jgi:hypothetical protein
MLKSLIDEFIRTGVDDKLLDHLASNSNLPGPRGNLELAAAFANSLTSYNKAEVDKLWNLCQKMTGISAEEAPVNSAREFIPFCGAVGVGSIAAANSAYYNEAVSTLRGLASDSRWRMREGVAMGLQKLMASNANAVLNDLKKWVSGGNLLEMRAVAAAAAEPALLKNQDVAKEALQLNVGIVRKLIEVKDRKSEDFRVLRKALGYTLSVVIVPLPKEGFEYLRDLAKTNDPDINWIFKENLKKNRLIKNFPGEVNAVKDLFERIAHGASRT